MKPGQTLVKLRQRKPLKRRALNHPQSLPNSYKNLPEAERERIISVYAASTSTQLSGPMPNPVLNKLEPQHLTDIIALRSKTIDTTSADRKNSRLFSFLTLALLVAAALAVILTFAIIGENDLLLEIVKLGVAGLGGFGGGFGFAAWRRNRE